MAQGNNYMAKLMSNRVNYNAPKLECEKRRITHMKAIKINKKTAKKISYGEKRNLKNVYYIVFHYTGNKGDTAKNNANYFATSNTRAAGAHFFMDKQGEIWRSIPMNRVAYAVGGNQKTGKKGEAEYYGKCTNKNSVSIELCDCINDVNWTQMVMARKLAKYIQKKCPNAKTIIRHWDVNGKDCPMPMTGADNAKWRHLHNYITRGYQYKAKVIKDAAVRSSAKVAPGNKLGTKITGGMVCITKISDNGKWGRLKNKTSDGKYRWISLKKVAEV